MTCFSKFSVGLGLLFAAIFAQPVFAVSHTYDPNGQFILVEFDFVRSSRSAQQYGQDNFGTDLVTINSAGDVQAALDFFDYSGIRLSGNRVHFGLRQTRSDCSEPIFIDGTVPTFSFWDSGEPFLCQTRSATVMDVITGRWRSIEETTALDYYALYDNPFFVAPVPLPTGAALLASAFAVFGAARVLAKSGGARRQA